MIGDLGVAGFLGLGGLVLGCIAGWRIDLRQRGVVRLGLLLGVGAGLLMPVEITREVADSSSSTAAIGLLFVPFPPVTNGVGGLLGAAIVHGWRLQRHLPDELSC